MHYWDSSDRIHLLWVRRTYELSKHKEVQSWQSAVFVEKALISETMWVILIEDLIECGNQTSRKLNVMLMVLINHYTFVLLVWDPTKLKEHKKKHWGDWQISASHFCIYQTNLHLFVFTIPGSLLLSHFSHDLQYNV